jgi:glucose 1-dehydrogenase
MRALTVTRGRAESGAVVGMPEQDGPILTRPLAVGARGTDEEIVSGAYGGAPQGEAMLIIDHEALAELMDRWRSALRHQPDDIKTVIDITL